ncbi:hypothetical protein XA68_17823 [Ophiocordyceps unilateralis]|uniref:20S-pre-rRNA D-site endonuclease NOB1 n=1 Tax=Ophiocordyceps unilateralis TaxID=268505 RepID=A0A2A9P3D0_OPHUN|nr:hypothetical protein XA68_17823 [Ophiocordyceps unilateralis]
MAAPPPELGTDPSSPRPPTTSKPIHSLVLDTGPLIRNDPPVSVLMAKAEALFTIPSVLAEIRDQATRSRVETTLRPLLTLRTPKPESLRFIQGFAKKTGDLAVLSRPDLEVLALTYELECERNGGDWRLRSTPGQKGMNGRPEKSVDEPSSSGLEDSTGHDQHGQNALQAIGCDAAHDANAPEGQDDSNAQRLLETAVQHLTLDADEDVPTEAKAAALSQDSNPDAQRDVLEPLPSEGRTVDETSDTTGKDVQEEEEEDGRRADESDSEGGEWITPTNVKKHQALDVTSATPSRAPEKTLQAAVLTSDYAMQNVALRMNLNLVTPSLARITRLKNWVLRCHGCFAITKEMEKQFCPSCGQPTLLRASCSTDEHGIFRIHLKSNFQWNKRGNVYSVPKPVHGSASGRRGKNGWGHGLMLAGDQKEYVRAVDEQRRERKKDVDLMDEDRLPALLSRERAGGGGGRIRVGAGRNVNAKRRHR